MMRCMLHFKFRVVNLKGFQISRSVSEAKSYTSDQHSTILVLRSQR